MFDSITYKLSRNTNLSLNWVKPEITYGEILDMPNTGSKNDIAVPILIDMDDKNPCLVKVYKSSGYAFLVRRDVKKPLSQLGGSFINGGQVIGLILILTGIAGICIWCLDRRRNPDNFPTPFIPGAWNGFWWAFVTMSTVGRVAANCALNSGPCEMIYTCEAPLNSEDIGAI
ncbi:hypothetical protein AC249_AIPGENE25317 [Exaiptasia diaphana]|nr:hypothetical protein AC249_AIPGENE25317 [Exaiptasia diaphana]